MSANHHRKRPSRGDKRLEMIMRDCMDSLLDSTTYMAYEYSSEGLEILSIEPPKVLNFRKKAATVTKVHPSPDISEYLIQRELHLERYASSR